MSAAVSHPDTNPDPTYCAKHPNVETALSCGRCGTPICPRCSVMTPVGARCRDCAQLRRLPTFQVGAAALLKGTAAALVAAMVGGIAWGVVSLVLFLGYLGFFLAMAIGYGIGEAVSRATNRKQAPQLVVLGVASVIVAFAIRNVILMGALVDVRDLWGLISVVLAALVAAGRLQA